MPEIGVGKVYKSYIQKTSDGLDVILYIPEDAEELSKPFRCDDYQVNALVQTLKNGYKEQLSNEQHPMITASGGMLHQYADDSWPLTRKDLGSPRDKGGQVPLNGFAPSREYWFNIHNLQMLEGHEERFYVSPDGKTLWLPPDPIGTHFTTEAAKRVGLDVNNMKTEVLPVEYEFGKDRLYVVKGSDDADDMSNVYCPFFGYGSISDKTGFNKIAIAHLSRDPEDLVPYDGEYFVDKEGRKIPLGREVLIYSDESLRNAVYGDRIEPLIVWESPGDKNKIASQRQVQEYEPGDLPYIWKPCSVVQWTLGAIGTINRPWNSKRSVAIRYPEGDTAIELIDEKQLLHELGIYSEAYCPIRNEIINSALRKIGRYDQD